MAIINSLKVRVKSIVLAGTAWLIYQALRSTWQIQVIEPAEMQESIRQRRNILLAHWHGDELALLFLIKRYRVCTMVSLSEDGQIMARFLKWLGGTIVRGSSSRQGALGLKALIHHMKKHHLNASFAVDGPKGPIYKVKPGIFQAQRLLSQNTPIFVAGVACNRMWRFHRSWNKAILPKPFAKLVIQWTYFEPSIPKLSSRGDSPSLESYDPRDPQLAEALEQALHKSREQAQNTLAGLSL